MVPAKFSFLTWHFSARSTHFLSDADFVQFFAPVLGSFNLLCIDAQRQSSLAISPALPCSRIIRIIDPAAALYRACNIYNTGIELRGRTASARGAYMENTGIGLRVGRDV